MRTFGVFLAVLLVLSTGAMAQPEPAAEIVPGQSIGPVKIGMPLDRPQAAARRLRASLEETRLRDGVALCFGSQKGNDPPMERYLLHGGFCSYDFRYDSRMDLGSDTIDYFGRQLAGGAARSEREAWKLAEAWLDEYLKDHPSGA